jgi:hypothetical protein
MSKSTMKATTLRTTLSVIIFLLVGLSAAGFYFGQAWLMSTAASVSRDVADSKAGGSSIAALKKVQAQLDLQQGISAKASSVLTTSQTYQNQAIADLNIYAANAGIVISNYTFAAAPVAGVAATATAAPAASTAGVAGASPTTITVALSSPMSYTKLLKFMSAIEGNLPKMQVSSVNLNRIDGSSDSVKTEQLIIEMYTQ